MRSEKAPDTLGLSNQKGKGENQMASYRIFFSSDLAIKLRAAAIGLVLAGAAPLASAGANEAGRGPALLALGDSVVFGYITQDGFDYVNPHNFIGYPLYVGAELRLDAVNASCPGETTGSFISETMPDNGCRAFRASAPLHTTYTGSQLEFATKFLTTHPWTQLVTIGLGANDVFLLEAACSNSVPCVETGLPAVLAGISSNMDIVLRALRATGYRGVLMVVNYYSLDYTDPVETGIINAINGTLATVAGNNGAVLADAFTAFQKAASTSFAGGKTCLAGLLNVNPQNNLLCDVHPAQSGQQILADVVEAATGRLGR
jgi:lysophospholipase L1-like esterase